MLAMAQLNPELAKSTPADSLLGGSGSLGRPGSLYSPSGRNASISSRHSLYGNPNADLAADEVNDDDEVPVGDNFTYIPPNPKKYFKRLLEFCLLADLEVMLSPETEETDEVSLGILSVPHLELLNECAIRWRIGHPYRATCFLDLVRQFYERGDIPMECIPEALHGVERVLDENDLGKWTVQDVRTTSSTLFFLLTDVTLFQSDFLASVYGGLFSVFMSALYHSMEALPNVKKSEVEPYLFVLEAVRDSGLLERFDVDVSARLGDVEEQVRNISGQYYQTKIHELQSAPGVNRALPLLLMTDDLEKSAKLLSKRFPTPLLKYVYLLVFSEQVSNKYL